MDITDFFCQNSEVAVAFSGGVDSAVLLALAKEHAKRVEAYCVKSQFQPQFELDDAVKIAELLSAEIEIIPLDVLSDSTITANPENRCYYCKKKVFAEIIKHAAADGFTTVIDGTNATDDASDRPGFRALGELRVLSPLRLCGYTKAAVRQVAGDYGLPVADKPSYACLATRIPTGVKITEETLAKTEAAENLLRNAGYKNFRIRYADGSARLELGRSETELFRQTEEKTRTLIEPYYDNIFLDPKERADE